MKHKVTRFYKNLSRLSFLPEEYKALVHILSIGSIRPKSWSSGMQSNCESYWILSLYLESYESNDAGVFYDSSYDSDCFGSESDQAGESVNL